MTTPQLLDLLKSEIGNVFTYRGYRDSRNERVLVIDMHYSDDVDRVKYWLAMNAPTLNVSEVQAGWPHEVKHRRLIVMGFSKLGGR